MTILFLLGSQPPQIVLKFQHDTATVEIQSQVIYLYTVQNVCRFVTTTLIASKESKALKGLSDEMDLAFDDMYDQFQA